MCPSRILCLLGVGLSLVACEADFPFSAAHLYPLSVGAYWIYERVDVLGMGPGIVGLDTLRVLDDTVIHGTTWYRMSRSEILGLNYGREYFANKSDGLWALTLDSDSVSFYPSNLERLYFRYPTREGDRYEVDPWSFTFPFTVTSIGEPCASPDGTRCIRYEDRNGGRIEVSFHIAPGVGLVQLEFPDWAQLDSLGHLVHGSRQYRLIATNVVPPGNQAEAATP